MVRVLVAALLVLLLGGCATFPDQGPREWREQLEGQGQLGGPPVVPPDQGQGLPGEGGPGAATPQDPDPPQAPTGCVDPDPQVVATCLDPVGAIAVLPDNMSALVGERRTGRVLQVRAGAEPTLVTTVPVDATGGGGLTGLVLSPSYREDQLVYAYVTTPQDNRVVRIAPGEAPKPVLTGIPRGARNNHGALAVDVDGSLLVATGDAGGADPASLAGKLLRIDTRGRPARGYLEPASPVLSAGLRAPGGICINPLDTTVWVTDRTGEQDALYLVVPGPLGPPAWTWPERPGVAGCVATPDWVGVALSGSASFYVLRTAGATTFTGNPETYLTGDRGYGRLEALAVGPDQYVWAGTANKDGGTPKSSDDRAIRFWPPVSNAASKA